MLTVVRASLLPPRDAPLPPERLRGTNEETVPLTRRITMRTTGHGKLNIRSRMEEEGRIVSGIHFPWREDVARIRASDTTDAIRDLIIRRRASDRSGDS